MNKIAITLLTALLPLACPGQPDNRLQEYLEIQQQRIHFNGVVLVTKDNHVLHRAHTGTASYELNVPMSDETVFRIASVSKQFTAALIALAEEEGRLRPDDSLSTFFPDLADAGWRKISLLQLLSHTSGIPHNEGIPDYWPLKSRLPIYGKQALAEIFAMKLLFKPGTGMHYSSPGYGLLAHILEIVYRQPYAQILEEKILRPLQLRHTDVYTEGRLVPGMASPYHVQGDSLRTAPYRDFSLMKGSGDLYSCAEDLSRWNNSFSTSGLWSEKLKERLFTPPFPRISGYACGWLIRPEGRRAWYHGGGTFGCSALSAWYPDEKVSILILSNVSVLPVNELWRDIEKIVFNETFELPALTQSIRMDAAQLQAYAGRYRQEQRELQIMLVGSQLYAKMGANPAFEIYPENKMTFFGKKVNIRLTFKSDDAEQITGLEADVRGQVHQFIKQ